MRTKALNLHSVRSFIRIAIHVIRIASKDAP